MARQSKLLSETDPQNLQQVALGTFLAVLVFFGAFATADSAVYLTSGESTLIAGPQIDQLECISATDC